MKTLIVLIIFVCSGIILAQPNKSTREIVHPDNSQNRLALVIGNGEYQAVSPLNNAVKDSRDMTKTLRELGFDVIGGENLSGEKMKRAILEFGEKLTAKKGIGVFYYAGHGVQLNGRNYLIPIEAKSLREQTIEFDAVDVNRVLAEMDAAENGLNLVILDACRNNPFSRSWRNGGSEGLANISAPSGTLIAYATAPGEVASDGKGENGLYTSALLKWMREPDTKVEDMFKKVRVEVAQKSQNKQIPWESSSLQGDFYFNPKILKKAIAEAQKNPKKPDNDNIKVNVNPVSGNSPISPMLGSRPKYRGTLLSYLFETPYLRDAESTLEMKKREVSYFVETLSDTVKLEMVEIRGGSFTMGSTPDEARKAWKRAQLEQDEIYKNARYPPNPIPFDQYSVETPSRKVSVKPFFMGKFEVSQGQWKAVMGDLPPNWKSDSYSGFKGNDLPIFAVTWKQAKEFCQRLSQKTGKKYRLPSEAEWEYAARAGTDTQYAFGDSVDKSLVNFGYPSLMMIPGLAADKFYPNSFGLFQMHGNIDEMVEDVWNPNHQNAPNDGSAVKSGTDQTLRVIRGGNVLNLSTDCRSASRDKFSDEKTSLMVGFRIVGEIQ